MKLMTPMDHKQSALEFYAAWFDQRSASLTGSGVRVVESSRCGVPLPGYNRPIDLFCLSNQKWTLIAHAVSLKDRIKGLEDKLKLVECDHVGGILEHHFGIPLDHGLKFIFNSLPDDIDYSGVFPLKSEDYSEYLTFFKSVHPNAQTDWLGDYFNSLVKRGYSWGICENGVLVSVTDAPEIPWMSDRIVEIGINTHPDYKRRGYAFRVCAAMIHHILSKGLTPIWSCSYDSIASQHLASRLGFQILAESYFFRSTGISY